MVVQKLSAAKYGSDCSSLSQDHNDLLMRNANDTEVAAAAAVIVAAEVEIRRCKAEAGTADSRHRKAEAARRLRQA